MADSGLRSALESHAKTFNGLLSLIPANEYYAKDSTDQWKRKKQTKAEKRAAKLAKLDPDNAKTVKDIIDEQAKKRKREEDGELSEVEGIVAEKPKEGLKRTQKKQKIGESSLTHGSSASSTLPEALSLKRKSEAVGDKRREKRAQKKALRDVQKAKEETKKARKLQGEAFAGDAQTEAVMEGETVSDEEGGKIEPDIEHIDFSGLAEIDESIASTATPSPNHQSPVFDAPVCPSGTSSITSIALASNTTSGTKQDDGKCCMKMPKEDPHVLQARLQLKIEALRAARKARTFDGTTANSRQELMESRRRKEEQRKAHKEELRRKAKEEGRLQREITLSQGSPLLSPPAIRSPATGSNAYASPLSEMNNFSFGRIAFDNGQSMTSDLTTILDAHKQKGPQDPRTALEAASRRGERLAALDPVKRADIEEKDVWLNAKKRAHGERVRNDTSLLKKTLKRKEQVKKKSEKEWGERLEGVAKGKAFKQKKREENLQKRRDEKGVKGKKKGKLVKGKKPKMKARPGFEGSFKAKNGGKKK